MGCGDDGFRVRVSLGRYFSDERRRALLWVSPHSTATVRHLEKRLRALFRLDAPFCLLKDDLLLPPTENVRVLFADDTVTVTPLSENFDFVLNKEDYPDVEENIDTVTEKEVKKKKRKKQKENNDENVPPEDMNVKINDKKKNEDSASSTPERRMNKKSSIVDNPKVISAIENIEKLHAELVRTIDDDDDDDEMKSKTLTMLKDIASQNINTLPSLVSDGRITKRKRLRVRKSKKNNQSMVSSLSDGESTAPHRNNAVVLINGKINSHIRFQTNDTSPANTVLRNKSHTIDEKPRIIQAIKSPKINSIPQPQPQTSGEHFIANGTTNGNHPSLEVILKDIDKFPPANVFPKENDIILFKKLKMNEQYTPVLSNYILGQVSNACADTSFVKFSILDGHSECIAPAGKFDIDESINDENEINEIDLVWNQVINPKFIQS